MQSASGRVDSVDRERENRSESVQDASDRDDANEFRSDATGVAAPAAAAQPAGVTRTERSECLEDGTTQPAAGSAAALGGVQGPNDAGPRIDPPAGSAPQELLDLTGDSTAASAIARTPTIDASKLTAPPLDPASLAGQPLKTHAASGDGGIDRAETQSPGSIRAAIQSAFQRVFGGTHPGGAVQVGTVSSVPSTNGDSTAPGGATDTAAPSTSVPKTLDVGSIPFMQTEVDVTQAAPADDPHVGDSPTGPVNVLDELFGTASPSTQVSADDKRDDDSSPEHGSPGTAEQVRPEFAGTIGQQTGSKLHSVDQASNVREALPPGTDVRHVLGQVTHGIETAAASDNQSVRLRLEPAGLGHLQIDVSFAQGSVSARLEAESSATHTLLQQNMSQLRDALTQQGVALDRLVVERRSDGSAGPNQGSFGQATQQQTGQQSGDDPSARHWGRRLEDADTPVVRRTPQRGRTGRLDMQV